jgi:RHS repeat-associated protein
VGRVSTYTYDGLGRLTNEAESGATDATTYAYTYDSRSNRATLTASGAQSYTTAYSYDINDRLLQTTKTTGQTKEIVNYHYDANGNTLSALTETLTTGSGTPSLSLGSDGGYELYTYNGFNQLVSTIQDGVETTYVYKPDGLRYNKATNGNTTIHIWDGANIAAELTGSTVTTYVRGINLITKGGGSQYHSFNAHGDVVQLTNSSGTVTKNYRYDAFGVEVDPQGTDANPWRYCGEYWDRETGTVYLRARYYDPVVGRMLSEDSTRARRMNIFDSHSVYNNFRLNGGVFRNQSDGQYVVNDPLSLNLYIYCQNNPIRFIDPSGHDPIPEWVRNINSGIGTKIDCEKGFEFYEKGSVNAYAGSVQRTINNAIDKILNYYFSSNLPKTGVPNSVGRTYNPDGSIRQERVYGPDGQPVRDTDYSHGGQGHEFPHTHDWVNGQRQGGVAVPKTQDNDGTAEIVVGGAVAVGTGYVVYRIIRFIPSLFPPLWPTIPANALCP